MSDEFCTHHVKGYCTRCADTQHLRDVVADRDALRAELVQLRGTILRIQPPHAAPTPVQAAADGKLHTDGYFTWTRREGYVMGKRLPCDFYLAPVAAPEPDMRHPKIQALIGSKARREIELALVEQLIEDPNFETTAMDMEYWGPMHDRLKEKLLAAPVSAEDALHKAAEMAIEALEWHAAGCCEDSLPEPTVDTLKALRAALAAKGAAS